MRCRKENRPALAIGDVVIIKGEVLKCRVYLKAVTYINIEETRL